eukprot:gene7628-11950_t
MSSVLLSPVSPDQSVDFPDVTKDSTKWKERNDRQLRLWGMHGQARIEATNVLLLNASSVGGEVLKNIVLPGFGKFTIVDDKKVTEKDFGKNFYVSFSDLGKSRAQSVCHNIAELNPDNVSGNYLEEKPETLINEHVDFFDSYSCVIASNMDTALVSKLSKICEKKKQILMVVRSYGMLGYIRVQAPSHEVIEGKLDTPVDDLRIASPWPGLQKYFDAHQFEKMDYKTHCHTPYLVVLHKMLEKFKTKHGRIPKLGDDKDEDEYTQLIHEEMKEASQRKEVELEEKMKNGEIMDEFTQETYSSNQEENFTDALKFAFKAYEPYEIPYEVQEILDDERAEKLTKDSTDFWFLVNGAKQFLKNEGKGYLPLPGTLPDMTSDTSRYIKLQSVFRRKAREDAAVVKSYCDKELEKFGRKISEQDVKEFCKNIYYIRQFSFKSIEDELDSKKIDSDILKYELTDSNSTMSYYVLLRCADLFYSKHGHFPGRKDSKSIENDSKELKVIVDKFLKEYDITELHDEFDGCIKEMVRFGCSENNSVSSLVGGVAAQELIKLCTKQRLPMVNTWLFSGIKGVSNVFKL